MEVEKKVYQNNSANVVGSMKVHFVWCTKYRYKIIEGQIALRCRELIRQGCEANGIKIISGAVGKDHVHLLVDLPTSMSAAKAVQLIKGRTSHMLQDEFPQLKKRYWGQHLWARGYYYGSVGEVTEDTIKQYIENQGNEEDNIKIFE